MSENYKVYLSDEMKPILVDLRYPLPEGINLIAESTSSFKKMFTLGQRRRHSTSADIETSGTYILTYPDNSIDIVCPSKGDFVTPGFKSVSTAIDRELNHQYSSVEILNRTKWKILDDRILLNENLISNRRHQYVYIYNRSIDKTTFVGWNAYLHDGRHSCQYDMCLYDNVRRGIKCANEDANLFLSQSIPRDSLESKDLIAFRLTSHTGDPYESALVLLGITPLVYDADNNYWYLNDDLPDTPLIPLSIKIGTDNSLVKVEYCGD